MKSKFLAFALLAVLLFVSGPLFAHHGNVAYDYGKHVTLKGTVVDWIWANPHSLLRIDVKGDDGKVVRWLAEIGAPATVIGQGWRSTSFKPGDQVSVVVEPMKDGRPAGRIESAVLADGTALKAGYTPYQYDKDNEKDNDQQK